MDIMFLNGFLLLSFLVLLFSAPVSFGVKLLRGTALTESVKAWAVSWSIIVLGAIAYTTFL